MSKGYNTNLSRRIAIGFVTYNPNNNLILRINVAIEAGFMVYIYDNSPTNNIVRNLYNNINTCKYFTCGKNAGLGFGISTVCAQAYYDSYLALVYFDQDTVFNLSTLDFIEDFYINNLNIASSYSAIVFNSKNSINESDKGTFMYKDVLLARSSGSLFYLNNLNKINWHDETYFVDCVDYEFCLNSNNHNLKIGECSMAPGFDHELEQPDIRYLIFGKDRPLRKYSGKRILSTTISSLRLVLYSLKTLNIPFAAVITRSYIIYVYWQIIIRLIGFFESIKWGERRQ